VRRGCVGAASPARVRRRRIAGQGASAPHRRGRVRQVIWYNTKGRVAAPSTPLNRLACLGLLALTVLFLRRGCRRRWACAYLAP
jgi:hypothetical protein